MILFHNDYNEACHQAVLDRLLELRGSQMPGYGLDPYCGGAAQLLRKLCHRQDLAVHFLVGGTQTNLTVIAAALRPHQGVIAADAGHIHVHETGAVEAAGHKVIALPSSDAKLTADQVEAAVLAHRSDPDAEHTVQPKMVYISNPSELGTIYSLGELEALSAVCRRYGLYLFLDGARLSYGLPARGNDVTMPDLARLTDVFYAGGTKCGAMFGEAVVFSNKTIAEDFRYLMKQRGGMLAKGWLLGAQFEALLDGGLYFEIAARANRQADQIRETLDQLRYDCLVPTVTNQIFPILPDALLAELGKEFTFSRMQKVDEGHTVVRFCTSWATNQENVDKLCQTLRMLSHS